MNLKAIRALIEQGAADEDILDAMDAADHEQAAFGPTDREDFGGPTGSIGCDWYSKNDAGEPEWM